MILFQLNQSQKLHFCQVKKLLRSQLNTTHLSLLDCNNTHLKQEKSHFFCTQLTDNSGYLWKRVSWNLIRTLKHYLNRLKCWLTTRLHITTEFFVRNGSLFFYLLSKYTHTHTVVLKKNHWDLDRMHSCLQLYPLKIIHWVI